MKDNCKVSLYKRVLMRRTSSMKRRTPQYAVYFSNSDCLLISNFSENWWDRLEFEIRVEVSPAAASRAMRFSFAFFGRDDECNGDITTIDLATLGSRTQSKSTAPVSSDSYSPPRIARGLSSITRRRRSFHVPQLGQSSKVGMAMCDSQVHSESN